MKIALDGMGGDFAPANIVAGAIEAARAYPDTHLYLVGLESQLKAELRKHQTADISSRLEICHASQVVEMSDSGTDAVRRKKDSSISRAVDLVKTGEAVAVVSAGHTGAAVAACQIKLRNLPGVSRSGIACVMPTEKGLFLLMDAGANADSDPEDLIGYAIMGSVYAREVLGCPHPKVGLLSNGTEAGKGNNLTKACYPLLQNAPIAFHGNVEGHDLFDGTVDVVVCDGFVGNIVLKTSECLARNMMDWIKKELSANPKRQIGALLSYNAFRSIKRKTNTDEYGGMPLLGVNGICIKSHGNATPKAIKNAIRVAREAVLHQVNAKITAEMSRHHETQSSQTPPQPAAT
jgi:phosphate acyltransferase